MNNFKKQTFNIVALSLSLLVFCACAYADDHNENSNGISVEASIFYHNKYIDEGMRELEDGGIFTPEFVVEFENFHNFYIGAWWALADDEDFTETNLFIGKTFEWDDMSLEFAYIWIHEDEEDGSEEDHELEAVFSCDCLPWNITPEVGYVYSTKQDGGALEIELGKEIEMEYFSIEPYIETLVDFGYVSDEYDGLNHIAVGLEVSIPISDEVSLGIYGAHSFAEENIRREGEDDKTWGGIGLEFEI